MTSIPAPNCPTGIRLSPEGEPFPSVDDLLDEVRSDARESFEDSRGVKPFVVVGAAVFGVALLAVAFAAARRR